MDGMCQLGSSRQGKGASLVGYRPHLGRSKVDCGFIEADLRLSIAATSVRLKLGRQLMENEPHEADLQMFNRLFGVHVSSGAFIS